MKRKSKLLILLEYLFIYSLALCVLFPIINVFLNSFKTNEDINRVVFWVNKLQLDNYVNVLKKGTVFSGFANSLIYTGLSMCFSILVCSIAGYALGRRKEKIFKWIYIIFLASMMIPSVANLASLYSMLNKFHLIDNRLGIILIFTSSTIPMGILLFTGFVKTIPAQLDEAATIDGCGYSYRFMYVILPLMKQVMVTQSIVSSLGIWNDFYNSLVFLRSKSKMPLPMAVYSFMSEHSNDWGAVFALMSLACIPPILFFLFGQKYFYGGVAAGAIKG